MSQPVANFEGGTVEGTAHVREVFARLIASERQDSAAGAVAELIAEDRLDRTTFDEVVRHYGVAESAHFRDGLLDLVIHAVRAALRDHCLTSDERDEIRRLKVIFRVAEGGFFKHRRSDVGEILCGEVSRLLDDEHIDLEEALYEVELQALFDLAYDEFLELTRPEVTRVVDRTIASITADGVVSAAESERLLRQLLALNTVYRLSYTQRQAIKRAGWDPGPGA
jgi:hypothetical protein